MSLDITGIGELASAISNVVDRIFPDADTSAKAKLALELQALTQQQAQDTAQAAINQAEAGSGNWYASSWRPTCAWICVVAFGWVYVVQPLLVFALALFGVVVVTPSLDLNLMLPVLFSLLGFGALRSVDKYNGVAK